MLENITNTIENKIDMTLHGYVPGEFMPIYEDGELANKREFMAYRIGRVTTPIYDKMLTSAKHIAGLIDDAIERSNHPSMN